MLRNRKSGQILSRNCSKGKSNCQASRHNSIEEIQMVGAIKSKLSYDIRINHTDEESITNQNESDTMRTVIKSKSSYHNGSFQKPHNFIQKEELSISNANEISIRSDGLYKQKYNEQYQRSLKEKSYEQVEDSIQMRQTQKKIFDVEHSQSIYYQSKPLRDSIQNLKISRSDGQNMVEQIHGSFRSQKNESFQSQLSSMHNNRKYVIQQYDAFSSVEKEVIDNLNAITNKQNAKVDQKSSGRYKSQYVSSDIGNGHDSSIFGDSLAMYENPLLKNQEIVKKLSHVSNIFKDISKLKQERISLDLQNQLKGIQGDLLQVEKGILRF